MKTDGNAIAVYVIYVFVAVGLTAWLAQTLFRSGVAFLNDVFVDKPALASAVNHLLVVGFYMLNLGYALFIIRATRGMDGFAAAQNLVNALAKLLVSLAGMHFVNVIVFWKIRGKREQRHLPLPIAPRVVMPSAPAVDEA